MDSQDIRAQDGVLPQGMRALPAGLWLLIIPNLWLFLAFRGEGGGIDLAQPVAPLEAMRWLAYGVGWVLLNLLVLRMGGKMERHLLHPLRQIIAAMEAVRHAHWREHGFEHELRFSWRHAVRDMHQLAALLREHHRKHQEVREALASSQQLIAQFTARQETIVQATHSEVGQQYRCVLSYANYLEEQILAHKLESSLRQDFDDVCESSFSLKLIAGALAGLDNAPSSPEALAPVPLAELLKQTMLALAPALDRRSMRLSTAEVDLDVVAQGDASILAHVLWMMLLGMIRFAAEESLLRIRCLPSRDGTQALMSIVVSELSPGSLSEAQREAYLLRKQHHLSPHLFAQAIREHAHVQLAELLLGRVGGSISVLPLTVSACEICVALPSVAREDDTL